MTSDAITICLDEKNHLRELDGKTHRRVSFLAVETIDENLKMHEWQMREIKNGLAEADATQLVEHENIVKQWKRKSTNALNKRCKSKL